jgi:DNA invertase Pin-like site-specific DNA recombinase/DNA-binding transcriptional regulator YiaG
MSLDAQKVTASHLRRDAYLYIRQSTMRQVVENTESTQRHYALQQHALRLGWPSERLRVIDCDQGQSGATSADREGFQQLVAAVSLGRAGIVLGLEVSRLARNSTDWHRLLEICAVTETLILDEDGLYDPRLFNDRLLLGLKGTLSEAELHVLHARLQGGIRNKARRGELKKILPTGLEYDAHNKVILDPNRQIRQTLASFFQTFERLGSATATVKFFRRQDWLFPRRQRPGRHLLWAPLTHSLALDVLHNPRYAGCYVHGQSRSYRTLEGKCRTRRLPLAEWDVVLPGAHAGYITWEQYQRNRQILQDNSRARGAERRCPPREGPALLQGLVVCGRCGQRMTVRYHAWKGTLKPDYCCQRDGIQKGEAPCQIMAGATIDRAVGDLLVQLLQPLTLEVSLAVQQELQSRLEEADRLRKQQVERARYEADQARERFVLVDPNNRLVADTLEGEWNEKLRALQAAQQHYEQQRQADRRPLDDQTQTLIRSLASDFPKLWHDPYTCARDRKRIAQLLLEDVTLSRGAEITLHIRFKGGLTRTLTLPLPQPAYKSWQTDPEIVALIDQWLEELPEGDIAARLNEQGFHTGKGQQFTRQHITNLRASYGLTSRYQRLREKGMRTVQEMAQTLGVSASTVKMWRRGGLLVAYDCGRYFLYAPVAAGSMVKWQGVKLDDPRRNSEGVLSQTRKEV